MRTVPPPAGAPQRSAQHESMRLDTTPALPRKALLQLLGDVRDDLVDYTVLAQLLEQQFDCALRQDAAPLAALAQRILVLVDRMDARRLVREALVSRLLGEDEPASMAALLDRMPAASSAPVQALWDRLEQAARDCKRRNARNARLMTEQQELLRRVLGGDPEPLYAGV